ncbi:cobalamin B12-binding domain-containing protein [Candidatus Viridilinea mediisalina]|nr:cobalamin-dependent protein [Candidatus Viridilinea mediisalina]
MQQLATTYEEYLGALRSGDRRVALNTVRMALAEGADIRDLYMDVLQPAMYEVGRLWETNQFTVAQEHLATAITQSVMAQIYAAVICNPPIGRTMVATCIGGELHELGIRMVSDFFEIEGWDVFYLGANMPPDDVISMIDEHRAHLLAISVTLGGHVMQVRELINAVRASHVGRRVKIMVGGQPLNRSPDAWKAIGADFTAGDAREAVKMATEVLA